MSGASTRSRRSSQEIRQLLLDAARVLFLADGYDATTTRDIADRAGVGEGLLFTNFSTKERLFDEAVVAPFAEVIGAYVASWRAQTEGQKAEARVRQFVDGIYDLARENRAVLISSISRRLANRAGPEELVLDHLARTLQGLDEITITSDEAREYHLDTPASIAAAAGMVFGVALLDDLIFPTGARRPSRARLTDEMSAMILDGVRHRGRTGG